MRRKGIELVFALPESRHVPFVLAPLLTGGYYEERFLMHIRSLRREGDYIDVGAHLGTHMLWFALLCPARHVHAFEPVARYAHLLRKTVALNGVEDRVTIHEFGLSDHVGDDSNVLTASHQQGFSDNPQQVTESFFVRRLDDVVPGPVGVIKLDVEGMEAAVLAGATRILREHSPIVFAEARSSDEYGAIRDVLRAESYVPTGRVFNDTPTYEFRKPSGVLSRARWSLRSRPRNRAA